MFCLSPAPLWTRLSGRMECNLLWMTVWTQLTLTVCECSHAWDLIQISKTFMQVFRETVSTCKRGHADKKWAGLKPKLNNCGLERAERCTDNVRIMFDGRLNGWVRQKNLYEDLILHFCSGTNAHENKDTVSLKQTSTKCCLLAI